MAGFARPELLASTEWLAEELGRPDVRIVDCRWRPDGTGEAAFHAGHLPGASYLDCFTAFVADVYAAAAGDPPDGLPTFDDGLRAAVITDAVLASAAGGGWVEVPAVR